MIKGTPKIKTVKSPRISVNKLAEYLEATPQRRKQIVYDAKHPSGFIVTRYKDARSGAIEYLSHDRDEDIVLRIIETIEAKKPTTEFQEQDFPLSVEALEALLDCELSSLDGCDLTTHDNEKQFIPIKGVDISVNPDLIIRKTEFGITKIGALKLHIAKNPLTEESQKIVGVMLLEYANKFLTGHKVNTELKLCFSLDMFGKCLVMCPSSYKHRLRKIEAACEEISLWWGTL